MIHERIHTMSQGPFLEVRRPERRSFRCQPAVARMRSADRR